MRKKIQDIDDDGGKKLVEAKSWLNLTKFTGSELIRGMRIC